MILELIIIRQILRKHFIAFDLNRILVASFMFVLSVAFLLILFLLGFFLSIHLKSYLGAGFRSCFLEIIMLYIFADLGVRLITQKSNSINFSTYYKIGVKLRILKRIFLITNLFNFNNFFSISFLIFLGASIPVNHFQWYFIFSFLLVVILNCISSCTELASFRFPIIKLCALILLGFAFIFVYSFKHSASINILSSPGDELLLLILLTLLLTFIYLQGLLFSNILLSELPAPRANSLFEFSKFKRPSRLPIWALVEAKFMLRTHRFRLLLLNAPLLPLFVWARVHIYNPEERFSNFFAILTSASILAFTYGQFIFSWNAGYISFLISVTDKAIIRDYIRSKYLMLMVFSAVIAIPIIGIYVLQSLPLTDVLCVTFYSTFILPPICLFWGLYNAAKIDIHSRGIFASWDGFNGKSMLPALIFYFITSVLFVSFLLLKIEYLFYFLIAIIGIVSCMLSGFWINKITDRFLENRHLLYNNLKN